MGRKRKIRSTQPDMMASQPCAYPEKGITNSAYEQCKDDIDRPLCDTSRCSSVLSNESSMTGKLESSKGDTVGGVGGRDALPAVGVVELFQFADRLDRWLIAGGLTSATICGATFPLMFVLFGQITRVFTEYQMDVSDLGISEAESKERFWRGIVDFCWRICVVGLAFWLSHYIFVICLNYSANRQVLRIRKKFFNAVLRQEMAWYDLNTANDFASRMTEDLNKVQDGMGEKIGMFIRFFMTFILAFVYAFIENWLLTLVLCATIPIIIILGGVMGEVMARIAKNEIATYSRAGALAEEVLSSLKTVVAFGGEATEAAQFSAELSAAERNGIARSAATGLTMGLMFGLMYCVYGLGFWYGVKLVMDDQETDKFAMCTEDCVIGKRSRLEGQSTADAVLDCINSCFRFDPGTLTTVLFGILQGGMQVGQSATFVEAFNTARAAAANIFLVINRVSAIDSENPSGQQPTSVEGRIEFRDVEFSYPSRPGVPVLTGLHLVFQPGKTTALVGASGCGKSTCVQLIQRLYDPLHGAVYLDGRDLRLLHVGWLRDQIGVVSQEPILFDATIRQNISFGRPSASEADIVAACKEANAYEFIKRLPQGLDTRVGEGGASLSGGQKQRIAIARALVRQPRILLLDEATSALDNESEAIIQTTLEAAGKGRTTVVVAQRLSTIRTADNIIVLADGQAVEQGTHDQLMLAKGRYYSLVMQQAKAIDNTCAMDRVDTLSITASANTEQETPEDGVTPVPSMAVPLCVTEDNVVKPVGRFKLFLRLLRLNLRELFFILVGIVAAAGFGTVNVFFAVIFGNVLTMFADDPDIARPKSVEYGLLFALLGLGCLITISLQGLMFGLSGERLTRRVRSRMFEAMLKQEMAWFDRKENNTGALCSRLSSTAQAVGGATGSKIGQIMQGVATIVFSFALALHYNWKVGLVTFAFIPVLIVGMLVQMVLMFKHSSVQVEALETSARFAADAIKNIRTVAALGCEKVFQNLYDTELTLPYEKTKRWAHIRGVIFGFANSSFTFAYAVTFAYGGHVYMEEHSRKEVMEIWIISIAVLNGALFVGLAFAFVTDFNLAFAAAETIFELLDRQPPFTTDDGLTGLEPFLTKFGEEEKAHIEFDDAEFAYPSRPDQQILRKLQLVLSNGERVALVGHSGCGKSTIIQLIQRFYDIDNGRLRVCNQGIQVLNLSKLRGGLGIVSQEPALFNRSIADNIRYGDHSREVPLEEVIKAAKQANIHEFIQSLPDGYQTMAGRKGSQLSGGQKQRIAIARALIRNPRILLLDEATSALDSESEKLVQDSLESAQDGRTSLVIAHRLSTIVNADTIFYIDQGQVAECGNHSELMAKRGLYYALWNRSLPAMTS